MIYTMPDAFISAFYYGVAPGGFQWHDIINMALRTWIN